MRKDSNGFRYATIDVAGSFADFHRRAQNWDDGYVKFVHFLVLNELRCRIGQTNYQRFIDDLRQHKRSVVVGSKESGFLNQL